MGIALSCGKMSPTASAAGVVVETNGFEGFNLAPLAGQDGWASSGTGATSATVQSTVTQAGSRAVQVNRAAGSDRRWAKPLFGPPENPRPYPTQRFIAIDWDMRVTESTTTGFGPFFGVEAYDEEGPTSIGLLGSLGVDARTGDVLYQAGGSGVLTETEHLATFDDWHHFRLVLDFTAMNYRAFFDGTQVAMTTFVDGGFTRFTDADIAAFAAGGDPASQSATGTAYFDNFVVRDGLLGDYDLDGDVDLADYDTWVAAFGTLVNPAGNNADGNANGIVDAADYTTWRDNQGASLFAFAGSGSLGAATAVPEPSTIALLLLGCLPWWRRTRSR